MRYAIYFMPAHDTALWRFGSSAIGYDAVTGESVEFPDHPVYRNAAAAEWVGDPSRYGFHATLKAPFTLASGMTEAELCAAAETFTGNRNAFHLDRLTVGVMSNFVALTPTHPPAALQDLADACTVSFDPFRAPLTDTDRRRRLAAPLTKRQVENLNRWGYPYVFEDFRFHMTLTGALEPRLCNEVQGALSDLYARISEPVAIDAIAIFRQETRNSRFRVLRRFAFGG